MSTTPSETQSLRAWMTVLDEIEAGLAHCLAECPEPEPVSPAPAPALAIPTEKGSAELEACLERSEQAARAADADLAAAVEALQAWLANVRKE